MSTPVIDLADKAAVSLVSSGASLANGSISAVSAAAYDRMLGSTGGGYGYKHAMFRFSGAFSVAPTEGGLLVLKYRHLDIVGTGDEEAAETARGKVLGAFQVNNVTTTQNIAFLARDLPLLKAEFYLYNQNTGQTLSSGWTLDVLPVTDAY